MAMTDKLKFATMGFFEYSTTEGKEGAGVLLHFEQWYFSLISCSFTVIF